MNKMNKKGFTLIEMLVVIAIIAVLVSIIIPVVSSSTERAEAAADAANLRSMLATLTIKSMDTDLSTTAAKVSTVVAGAPDSASGDGDMYYIYAEATGVDVWFGEGKQGVNDIDHYAGIAGNKDTEATCTKYEAKSTDDTTCKNCGKAQHS